MSISKINSLNPKTSSKVTFRLRTCIYLLLFFLGFFCKFRLELYVLLCHEEVYNEERVGAVVCPTVDFEEVSQYSI